MTALLAIVIEKKVPTQFEGFSLLVLTSGVMVAVWEGAAGSLTGILICIAGIRTDSYYYHGTTESIPCQHVAFVPKCRSCTLEGRVFSVAAG